MARCGASDQPQCGNAFAFGVCLANGKTCSELARSRIFRPGGTDMLSSSTFSGRRGSWAFMLGVALVTAGVLLHLPMFLMGEMTHYRLYGMPMGNDMIAGMGAIVLGVGIAAYGLLPSNIAKQLAASQEIVVSPPEDAPLTRAHWTLMSFLVIALIAALLGFGGIAGTAVGIAKIIFFVAIVLFLISAIAGAFRGRRI